MNAKHNIYILTPFVESSVSNTQRLSVDCKRNMVLVRSQVNCHCYFVSLVGATTVIGVIVAFALGAQESVVLYRICHLTDIVLFQLLDIFHSAANNEVLSDFHKYSNDGDDSRSDGMGTEDNTPSILIDFPESIFAQPCDVLGVEVVDGDVAWVF